MKVVWLHVAPVKSLAIESRDHVELGKDGVEDDRRFCLIDEDGHLVNGKRVAEGRVPISAPLLFTANDCLDIGVALGSPVSLDYYDKAPFKFNGTIDRMTVKYVPFAKPAEAAAPTYAATQVAAR